MNYYLIQFDLYKSLEDGDLYNERLIRLVKADDYDHAKKIIQSNYWSYDIHNFEDLTFGH
jgi:hypothetical protein